MLFFKMQYLVLKTTQSKTSMTSPMMPLFFLRSIYTFQLRNLCIQKNRRRYTTITQIIRLKTHLISSTCYNFLLSLECIALPHFNTIQKLYSSFVLDMSLLPTLSKQLQTLSLKRRTYFTNG